MTVLHAVAVHLPPPVPLDDLRDELGLTVSQSRMFQRFYGLSEVARTPGARLADVMLAAAEKLTELRGREDQVRYVVHARSLQSCVPYPLNPLQEVAAALGVRRAVTFGLTQHACASGLLALDLCGRVLRADGDPDALALVFTGEVVFTASAGLIPGTAVMGEGSAAVLVAADGRRDRLLGYAWRTRGEFNGSLTDPDTAAAFQAAYAQTVAEVITEAAGRAGMAPADVDLILPHNVNRVSWLQVCRLLGYPVGRVFLDNVPSTGHCFGADPFINYHTARERGVLQPGHRYLMVSVGLGATFAAMVFEH